MADSSSPSAPLPRRPTESGGGLTYRCVCGTEFSVPTQAGVSCPVCHRHVTLEALREGASDTVSMGASAEADMVVQSADRAEADDAVGRLYGHYRVTRKLGQGGMGVVYEALDESLQRYVALKVIHAAGRSGADSSHIQRLQQEAVAQARVNHPHVVHIYFVGREDKTPFFAMELVPGETLADRLRDGLLPFSEVVAIGEQVADALRHAAKFDILHGDVKPSNVLIVDAATAMVKLSDFGLARRLSQIGRDVGLLVGTPCYLSPEVADGKPQDVRSDLYSLGITLFEMTFGRLPYRASSSRVDDYLQAHRTAPVEFPEQWPDSVPHEWRDVLEKLLAKSPDDRYQTYDELLAALRRLRPVALPKAGRLQRGLAWAVDLALAYAAQNLFYVPLATGRVGREGITSSEFWLVRLPLIVLGGLIPLLAGYLQTWWKTTPGKRLFQLRIVDRHGMTPRKSVLLLRSVFQFLPLWAATAYVLYGSLGAGFRGEILRAVAAGWLLADAGAALFRRGASLHDRLLKTRVVLDAGAERKS